MGVFSETFGFTPNFDVSEAYIVTLKGFGATWLFSRNGTVYSQVEKKMVGSGYVGNSSQQGKQEAGVDCTVCPVTVSNHEEIKQHHTPK